MCFVYLKKESRFFVVFFIARVMIFLPRMVKALPVELPPFLPLSSDSYRQIPIHRDYSYRFHNTGKALAGGRIRLDIFHSARTRFCAKQDNSDSVSWGRFCHIRGISSDHIRRKGHQTCFGCSTRTKCHILSNVSCRLPGFRKCKIRTSLPFYAKNF